MKNSKPSTTNSHIKPSQEEALETAKSISEQSVFETHSLARIESPKTTKSNICEVLSIPQIPKDRNYWIIRTNSGIFYQDFIMNNYISIAWDYITLEILNNNPEESVKKIIENNSRVNFEKLDMDEGEAVAADIKSQITTIYNKLKRFVFDINVGDIVLIPSKGSEFVSIGEVTGPVYEDDKYVERYLSHSPDTELDLCPYYKRRKVKWLKKIRKSEMDIYLLKAFNSQHALYSLNDYAPYINRNIYGIYSTGDELHTTINAGHPNGLTLKELKNLVDYLYESVGDIANEYDQNISEDQLEVKLNIHSPGLIELIGYGAEAIIALSLLTFTINNLINGGNFKISYNKSKDGEVNFALESDTKGLKGHAEKDKELEIKKKERLLKMVDELDIKSPEFSGAIINDEKVNMAEVRASEAKDKKKKDK